MDDITAMFDAVLQTLGDTVRRYVLTRRDATLTWGEVLDLWDGKEDAFRLFFTGLLRESDLACFRFETPPLTASGTDRLFEFVLVDSPEIDLPADPADFRAHFDRDRADVLAFDNLGRDALLIVPRPLACKPGWAHLASFTRQAPPARQRALWRAVGAQVKRRLAAAPLWLNTAGGGVPWLHVRLDSQPKYYVFDEYRRWTSS